MPIQRAGKTPVEVAEIPSEYNEHIEGTLPGAKTDVAPDSVDSSADTFTATAHGLENNDVLQFTGSDLPDPLVAATDYYVSAKTTDTFQLAASYDASAIDLTDVGSVSMTYSLVAREIHFKRTSRDIRVRNKDDSNDMGLNVRVKEANGTIAWNTAFADIAPGGTDSRFIRTDRLRLYSANAVSYDIVVGQE